MEKPLRLNHGGLKHSPSLKIWWLIRTAFDRIQQSGGYVSVNTGGVPDANEIPIPKKIADEAFDAAACIGCGACVAACKNASAMLFVSAKSLTISVIAPRPCRTQGAC